MPTNAEYRPAARRALAVTSCVLGLLSIVGCTAAEATSEPQVGDPAESMTVDSTLFVVETTVATASAVDQNPVTSSSVAALVERTVEVSIGRGALITALPPVGDGLDAGEPLLEVDGRPTAIVMRGTEPMTRALGAGVADGSDIAQLERNLVDLGYATSDEIAVDERWSDDTTSAVLDLQHAFGLDETGIIDIGDVVFIDGDVTVSEWLVDIGDAAAGPVLAATDERDRIVFELHLSDGEPGEGS